MNSLISIIIPTFNRANLIEETLDSVIFQTYQNWECILVDDGSEDQTLEVLNKYAKKDDRFKIFSRPNYKIKGANSCRNYGFELAKGDYIKWFDSDDLMKEDLLEEQMNAINLVDVCVCKLEYFDSINNRSFGESKINSDNIIKDYLVGNITYYISGPMWSRKFLDLQPSYFDENISNLDDWDFNLRMLYQNPTISYIDKPLIKYRIHNNSLSKEINKLNFDEIRSEINAREKHVAILKSQKNNNDSNVFNLFVLERLKYIFRMALIKKDKNWFQYLKLLYKKQVELKYFASIVKTISATAVFKIFGKGGKLLKQI